VRLPVSALAAVLLFAGPSDAARAETFNEDKLSFFAEFVPPSKPSVEMTLASLEGGFTNVNYKLVRGASLAIRRKSEKQTVGTLVVGSRSYSMVIPPNRVSPVTVARSGKLRAVLRSTSSNAGRRAFLTVTDGEGKSLSVRVKLRPGIVKVNDAGCIRVQATAERTATASSKITAGQGAACGTAAAS
jgi:hypothetical protein